VVTQQGYAGQASTRILLGVARLASMASTPAEGESDERPRLRQPRLAEMVAARVREDIVTGRLGEGARIPRQDQFARQLGVGISVVREALRILESEGLVVVHRGKIGGATVRRPTPAGLVGPLATLLQTERVPRADPSATLALLDGACAARCAVLPLRRRRSILALARPAAEDPDRFHLALADGCGLETLRLLVIALGELPVDGPRRACEAAGGPVGNEHELATRAIEAGAAAAAFVAASHLHGAVPAAEESASNP
jgi:GntR family transcriptional regulator, transcriptional repressor for pyruvate dehydrogenase complex